MLQLVDERRRTFEVFERMRTHVACSGAGRPATAAGGDAAASAAGAAAAAVSGADVAASLGGGVPGATCVAAADGTAVVGDATARWGQANRAVFKRHSKGQVCKEREGTKMHCRKRMRLQAWET
ncbi:unnamed protein product [Closterium sp. NIES-54]